MHGRGATLANRATRRAVVAGAVLAGALVGVAVGIGSFTFIYAEGMSYMTDDPSACANCHIMQGHLDAWAKSSHQRVAVCNDCHAPDDFLGKYYTKGINGLHHSVAFVSGWFHEPIRMTQRNVRVTEAACRRCHEDIVWMIDHPGTGSEQLSCIQCHRNVGHPN
jgi:cytochrome c nitrite reductase small subunit